MLPGNNSNFAICLVAGGTAGGIEAAVTYPIEFAKTRTQLRDLSAKKPQTNPFLVVRDLLKNEGITTMYKGCGVLVVGSIGKDAIRFLAFDSIKRRFAGESYGSLGPVGNMMAGVASGIIASTLIVTPSERVKTALIDDGRRAVHRFRSPKHAIMTILREDGLRGLYRGYAGTTLKQTGATAFRLGSFNIMKDFYRERNIKPGPGLDFVTGAGAGLVTTLATQPFDVVKTRSQSAEGTSTVSAVRGVFSDSGICGFWRGTTMRLGRTVLSGAILFTTYEYLVGVLQSFRGIPARTEM